MNIEYHPVLKHLMNEKWFYVAYDGTCLDGFTICDFSQEEPVPLMLDKNLIELALTEV